MASAFVTVRCRDGKAGAAGEPCYRGIMTVAVTRAAEGLDRRAFTVSAFERMAEFGIIGPDERLELIGGEIVPMASKGNRHERVKAALNYRWGQSCPQGFMYVPETALRLDAMTYLEPDFIVFSRDRRMADLRGPDILLIVEVADSSLDYDLRRKPLVYAGFGVRELWVVDVAGRRVHRYTAPLPDGFAEVVECRSNERLVPSHTPEAFAFKLDDLDEL